MHRTSSRADAWTSDRLHGANARTDNSPVMMSNHATARAAGNRGAAMTHGDGFGLKRARVNDRIIGRQRNSISGYGRRTNKHWRNQDSRKKTIFHSRARPDEKTLAESTL
jgi:hypothetical protein